MELRFGARGAFVALDRAPTMLTLSDMIRRCAACGRDNRVPARHLADRGRCGACKAELPPIAEPIDVDAAAFDEITREARVPVLVDYWAKWCAPCRIVAPEVARVARELAGRAVVLKVNTETQPELASRYNVQAIPLFQVFSKGRRVGEQAGAVDHRALRRWLEQAA